MKSEIQIQMTRGIVYPANTEIIMHREIDLLRQLSCHQQVNLFFDCLPNTKSFKIPKLQQSPVRVFDGLSPQVRLRIRRVLLPITAFLDWGLRG
jgi:hypothetical protein